MIRDSVGDWQELSELYQHADPLGPDELAAWLERQRADGHRLLGQVERMLAARACVVSGAFLEALPKIEAASERVGDVDWGEGSAIGAYPWSGISAPGAWPRSGWPNAPTAPSSARSRSSCCSSIRLGCSASPSPSVSDASATS